MVRMHNFTTGTAVDTYHTLTDTNWVRLSVTWNPTNAATTTSAVNDTVRLMVYFSGTSIVAGDTMYLWGAQVEALPFASSYSHPCMPQESTLVMQMR